MTVLITGVNRWNKGAELMMLAVCQHLRGASEKIQICVESSFGSYEDRALYGARLYPGEITLGRTSLSLSIMPKSFREFVGIVGDDSIDVVLDASGFAFGDQHPPARVRTFARRVSRWKSAGIKIILLPQALGPFEKGEIRSAMEKILSDADMIFARDSTSQNHLSSLRGFGGHVHLAPDFTNLVNPPVTSQSLPDRSVLIVPNERMIEKSNASNARETYIQFLTDAVAAVKEANARPIILVHGIDDIELASEMARAQDVSVIREDSPSGIKALIAHSDAIIASRFHALVSGLSQAIPCIATSWSHKYKALMADYGSEDLLLSMDADRGAISRALAVCIGPERSNHLAILKEAAGRQKRLTAEMWTRIDNLIGINSLPPDPGEVSG